MGLEPSLFRALSTSALFTSQHSPSDVRACIQGLPLQPHETSTADVLIAAQWLGELVSGHV
jgi:hypothetical protein